MSGDSRSIRVAVRVRPFNSRELEQNPRNIIKVLDQSTLIFDPDVDDDELFFFHGVKQTHRDITKRVKKKLTMEYDDVFDNTATNADIFEVCMRPLVQSVMNGYNCSVFVYGATGAGKTHTMLGNELCPGITFLTMQELFAQIDALSDTRKFDIGISYLEVYNELVMNLLTKSGPLKLREDSNGVVVSGLVLKQIHNASELLELLAIGNRNRTQHPTDANAESSRSHAIFQVHIRMCDKKTGQKRSVKLSMIDLAGSERAASTKGIGIRFKEGANINKSLLALGNCINKLADGLKHIPYRDSNLTRILKDSLGGNCQTVMIANISPSSLTYDDTYNTLKYASRAKKIRTTVRQNIVPSNVPKEFLLKKVNEQADENERLKAKLAELEAELQRQKTSSSNSNIICTTAKFDETLLNTWHSRIDSIYNSIRQAQQHFYLLQSKKKLLNQKSKVKEQAEAIARILTLDGNHLNEDIAKMDASIDRYAKQIAAQQSEMKRWLDRYRNAMRQLNALRDEVQQSEMATMLKSYLAGKESEIQAAKAILKAQHMAQCITTYGEQNKQWQAIMQLASEIVQQNYLLLRGIDRLDNVTLEKMRKLVKLNQRQRGVTFFDDDNQQGAQRSELLSTSGSDNSIEDIANLSECSEDAVDLPTLEGTANGTSYKRTIKRQDESESETEPSEAGVGIGASQGDRHQEEQGNVFKKPKHVSRALIFKPVAVATKRTTVMRKTPTKAKPMIQQQQRLKVPKLLVTEPAGGILRKGGGRLDKKQPPSVGDRAEDGSDTSEELLPIGGGGDGCDNPNSTFCINSTDGKETDSMFSNVLVESNVDADILDKVLRRASMKGKVTLSVNKENRKKSPKRIGKSPRAMKPGSRTNSSATAVINRYRMMKGKETTGVKSLITASTSSSSSSSTLPVGSKVGPVARLPGAGTNNNNLESDNDRNRHIRLMGIKK
ncbi:kinesin heavy chain [Anopheles darlingi]|uniref:Kinesin heavy chain n=1 Tax=Anopheles darlingi TaxID=43151 RepID=W5JJW0_ANODA|nr:kinesin-like protein KIF18A [Anopheles darlingi]ETN63598.1 kinesin heavy chain [Anopheles darlingi]